MEYILFYPVISQVSKLSLGSLGAEKTLHPKQVPENYSEQKEREGGREKEKVREKDKQKEKGRDREKE